MGGTSLVTKGILGPIEGNVNLYNTELPLTVEAVVSDMSIIINDEIMAEASLPDEITTETSLELLEANIQIPSLEVDARLEE